MRALGGDLLRRVKFGLVGMAAAAGLVTGAGALAPAAHAADLVQLCITLNPRAVYLTVAGQPLLGQIVIGTPKTCVGI